MSFTSYSSFGHFFQWDMMAIVFVAVLCMIAISVWLIRNRYSRLFLMASWFFFFLFLSLSSWRTIHSEQVFREDWKETLRNITRSFVSTTEMMGHAKITRQTEPTDPLYLNLLNLHAKWCRDIPSVAYVYTLRRHNNEMRKVDWIVSCPSDVNHDGKIEGKDEVGEGLYQPYSEWFEIFQKGFDGKLEIDESVSSEEYGRFVTAIAPLHDPENPAYIEAILGVDFRIDQWERMNAQIRVSSLQFLLLILALYLSALCFIAISQRTVARLLESNQELIAAKRTADAATKAKNDFLANMSHEIRTPMNALIGFTDILTQRIFLRCGPQEREESEGVLEIIKKSSNDLLAIINDILDFSKIEANQLQLDSIPLSIKQVLDDIWLMVKADVIAKHLDFSIKYKEPIPALIVGDPARLRQVLLHLIDNAVKFTRAGKVKIFCQMRMLSKEESGSSNKGRSSVANSQFRAESSILQIDISDTGIGISPEQMEHLFQPFTQVDTSTTRNFGGTGLGLSIAKRLAQLMDGNITAKSTPNVGSIFTLALQVYFPPEQESAILLKQKRAEEKSSTVEPGLAIRPPQNLEQLEPNPEISEKPLKNARILLVEDMTVNQLVISTQLHDAGAKVEITGNGQLGIDKITEDMDNGLFFDVVLMDMQMPVMDGYEATATLRQQGYTRPIIAITAHALTGDREKALEAGCDDYISKPVDRKILIETIKKYLKVDNS